MSSGLGSAGASIGHHASVNDVRESAFEAAQRLVPTLASGEFATEVAVAFGARHARLGERRDVERPVQLAVSTAAEAMALDLPARHLKRRRPRVAGVVRARGEATDRSAAPHDLRRQDHADAGDAREGAALYAQRSEKLEQIGTWPLVIGFSGSSGLSKAARADITSFGWKQTTFRKTALVRRAVEGKVERQYAAIRATNTPDSPIKIFFGAGGLWGLASYWTDEGPTILELEASGGTDTHEFFHAVGSGAQTAYAVWRTIGGRELAKLDEGRALHVALRILDTSVAVEMSGVSDPFRIFVITPDGARRVSDPEVNALTEAMDEWRERELALLLDQTPPSA